jgi:hypothetical protein
MVGGCTTTTPLCVFVHTTLKLAGALLEVACGVTYSTAMRFCTMDVMVGGEAYTAVAICALAHIQAWLEKHTKYFIQGSPTCISPSNAIAVIAACTYQPQWVPV